MSPSHPPPLNGGARGGIPGRSITPNRDPKHRPRAEQIPAKNRPQIPSIGGPNPGPSIYQNRAPNPRCYGPISPQKNRQFLQIVRSNLANDEKSQFATVETAETSHLRK